MRTANSTPIPTTKTCSYWPEAEHRWKNISGWLRVRGHQEAHALLACLCGVTQRVVRR